MKYIKSINQDRREEIFNSIKDALTELIDDKSCYFSESKQQIKLYIKLENYYDFKFDHPNYIMSIPNNDFNLTDYLKLSTQ